MKKKLVVSLVTMSLIIAMVSLNADDNRRGNKNFGQQYNINRTVAKIDGTLAFVDNYPIIKAKDGKTYNLHMNGFWFNAYTDSIKSGTTVVADGYLMDLIPGQTNQNFIVTKAVIGGKTYDLTSNAYNNGNLGRFNEHYNYGGNSNKRGFGGRYSDDD